MYYIPDTYYQDSSQSIVDSKGRYDFKHFSTHEANIIRQVLSRTFEKNTTETRGIGLAAEAYSIVYKPRYILHEIIIILYGDSKTPLNYLATAIAYETKGAYFRNQALASYELFCKNANRNTFLKIPPIFSPRTIYRNISMLYEKEHSYENAIYYQRLSAKYPGIYAPGVQINKAVQKRTIDIDKRYDEKRIQELTVKLFNPPATHRIMEMPQSRSQKEYDITAAAKFFIDKFL